MQQGSRTGRLNGATQEDVERSLADWLDLYADKRGRLSPWESHCFAMVLTFLRYGYYERALDQLANVLEPPTPLPIFPMHHLMSMKELLRILPAGVREHRRPAEAVSRCGEGADPAD